MTGQAVTVEIDSSGRSTSAWGEPQNRVRRWGPQITREFDDNIQVGADGSQAVTLVPRPCPHEWGYKTHIRHMRQHDERECVLCQKCLLLRWHPRELSYCPVCEQVFGWCCIADDQTGVGPRLSELPGNTCQPCWEEYNAHLFEDEDD